jgi:Flp pilus assembly pilin Flp
MGQLFDAFGINKFAVTSRFGFRNTDEYALADATQGVHSPLLWIGVRTMTGRFWSLWQDDAGQDIAEYAVMLAVILVIVVGTIRLIGSHANNVFSNTASSIQ